MRGVLVVVGLLVLGAVALVAKRSAMPPPASAPAAAPAPSATTLAAPSAGPGAAAMDPLLKRLETASFPPEHIKTLYEAGMAIQRGMRPSKALTPEQLALLPAVERFASEAVCPPNGTAETCARYRLDVPACFDRAAEIIDWRHRERDQVDRQLFVAAMGVSVTGREYPTVGNLVTFCQKMAGLDPARGRPTGSPQPVRNPS